MYRELERLRKNLEEKERMCIEASHHYNEKLLQYNYNRLTIYLLRDMPQCIIGMIFGLLNIPLDTRYDSDELIHSYLNTIEEDIPNRDNLIDYIKKYKPKIMIDGYNDLNYISNSKYESNVYSFIQTIGGIKCINITQYYFIANFDINIVISSLSSCFNTRYTIDDNYNIYLDIKALIQYYKRKLVYKYTRTDTAIVKYVYYMVTQYLAQNTFSEENKLKYLLYSQHELGTLQLNKDTTYIREEYKTEIDELYTTLLSGLNSYINNILSN